MMKKVICILLMAVLLFPLNGCTQKRTLDENNIGSLNMPRLDWLETKEEIETFNKTIAESDRVPTDFVKPDEWTMIGELERFGYSRGTYPYRHFILNVKDANGVRIALHMSYGESYSPYGNAHLSVSDDMTSMQYLDTPKTGFIERCRVLYSYDDGWLDTVVFYVGNIRIQMFLSGCGPENPYPEDQQETFYTKLLSLSDEVVTETIRELETSVGMRADNTKWLIPAGIGLGAVVVVVTGIVFCKKKKRKATVNKADEPTTKPQLQPADPLE